MIRKIIKNSLFALVLLSPALHAMEDLQPESLRDNAARLMRCHRKNQPIKTVDAALLEHAYSLSDEAGWINASFAATTESLDRRDKNCRKLQRLVSRLPKTRTPETILIKALNDGGCKKNTLDSASQTAHYIAVGEGLEHDSIRKPHLREAFLQLIAKEDELSAKGYLTFVHGQKRTFRTPTLLHTFLRGYAQNKSYIDDDFLFIHIKPSADARLVTKDALLRKYMLENGTPENCMGCPEEKRLLFMTHSAFANEGFESAFCFVTQNHNFINYIPDFKKIFTYSNYQSVYKKFDQPLKELHTMYERAGDSGTLLLVAVPETMAKESVYLAHPFGKKHNLATKDFDFRTMINFLSKQRAFTALFCMPVTADIALNPESGIKVFAFDTGDPDQLARWHQEKDKLFADIAQEIDKQKNHTQRSWYASVKKLFGAA